MDSSLGRFWVTVVASLAAGAILLGAGAAHAASTPPIADAWNITSTGKAESSGELLFRVTAGAGDTPTEVTVFVLSGTNETGIASSIRRALTTQLDANRYDVEPGEGANVVLSVERGNPGFSVELVDSDVENVRVSVQSATPVAPPTVPRQQVPANSPAIPSTPPAPGDANPPARSAPEPGPGPAAPSSPPAGTSLPSPASPSSPPAQPATPDDTPASPPDTSGDDSSQTPADGGAGAPASVPPPPPGAG